MIAMYARNGHSARPGIVAFRVDSGSYACSNLFMRANDPYRILVSQLIGAAKYTTTYGLDEHQAQEHLQAKIAGESQQVAAQAAADGARHWTNRAASGNEDEARARLASNRLRMLAEHLAGGPVEPTPAERSVTVSLPTWQRG